MKKNLIFSLVFLVGGTMLFGVMSVRMAQARDYVFRSVSDEKPDGRWFGASISCYKQDSSEDATWTYLVTGYGDREDPGDSRKDIQNYVNSLPVLPTSECTEWDVLEGTWKSFWAPPPPSRSILSFLPAILAATKQEYKIQKSEKVKKGFYSASITCLGGRWWRLARSYSNLPMPTREGQPEVFNTLAGMTLPENRSCSKEEEWETFQGQWVWFKRDGTLLYQ